MAYLGEQTSSLHPAGFTDLIQFLKFLYVDSVSHYILLLLVLNAPPRHIWV
jgi:hypothetical protein